MKRLYILAMAFIVCLGMALGATLFLSLLPHLNIIGWATLSLLCTAIGCCVVLLINFTFTKISIAHSNREHAKLMKSVITFDNGAAAYIDGTFVHLSAEHQRAMVQLPQTVIRELPSPKKVEGWGDQQTAIEIWLETGNSQASIAEQLNVPKSRVQKWIADYRKEHETA